MPHFNHSSITVATRRGRLLVIAAGVVGWLCPGSGLPVFHSNRIDTTCSHMSTGRWDTEFEPAPFNLDVSRPAPANFERRITYGWDTDMARIRAEFNGQVLHVSVPRRLISTTMGLPHTNTNRASAYASAVGAMRFNPLEVNVPPKLEMTRSHSSQSQNGPHRPDIA